MGYSFGLVPARGGGDPRMESSVASSAFSKGDVLVKAATSAISRAPINATSLCIVGSAIVGVANAASTESYGNQVSYTIADNDTEFWSRATTGQTFQEGDYVALQYVSAIYFAVPGNTGSTQTNVAVVVKGSNVQTWNANNSDISYVLVRFVTRSTGSLAYGG